MRRALLPLIAGFAILVFGGVALAGTTHFKIPFLATGSTQLHSADGLSGLLAQIRNRFGDTMGYELMVYPDHAVLYRADPHNNHLRKGYFYRAGGWSGWANSSRPALNTALADLSKFDVTGVATTLADAPQSLNITDASYSYLIVEGRAGGSVALSIYVTDGDTAHLDINADGTVKQLHPPS